MSQGGTWQLFRKNSRNAGRDEGGGRMDGLGRTRGTGYSHNLSEGHGSKETEEDVMIPRGSQG